MWVAVTSPGTELDAADRGIGSLGVTFTTFAEQEAKVKEYRRRIQNCNPVGGFVNNQVNTVNFLYCHEDSETGTKVGMRMIQHFNYLAAQLDMAKEAVPTKSYPSAGLLPSLRRQASSPGELGKAPEGIAVGNPAHLIQELRKWEACGVDRVSFMLNAAEIIPQEQLLASLRLFAKEVMPAFAEKQPAQAAAGGGR
jgi:hypothetical protein